jgi:hypothetical protein
MAKYACYSFKMRSVFKLGAAILKKAKTIHKPPALIRFAPIKHALAVTVEPFKFSPA